MINIDPPYIEMRKFVAAWVHIKPSQEHVYKFNRNLPYTEIHIGSGWGSYETFTITLSIHFVEKV